MATNNAWHKGDPVTAIIKTELGSFRQWFESSMPSAGQLSCRSAGSAPITLLRSRCPSVLPSDPTQDYVIEVVRDNPVNACQMDFGYGRFVKTIRPGSFVVLPPAQTIDLASTTRNVSLLSVAIPAVRLASIKAMGRWEVELLHTRVHSDPLVTQIVCRLWEEAVTGNPWGDLFADQALDTLLALVLRLADPVSPPPQAKRLLPARQFAHVVEYIHSNLNAAMSLADLAAVANLSEYHFARQFKQTTGMPPHQYVVAQRVERAKQLIREERFTLAQIAAEVGFSSQSHMNLHFKRLVACTPADFRQ